MAMSEAGRRALSAREGVGGPAGNRDGYYNDSAGNCTYGVGTLAHYGPCTADEMARHVDAPAAEAVLTAGIHTAERAVRRGVAQRALNQNQFDALVSAAYNSPRNLATTLQNADAGHDDQVADHLRRLVYVHQRDEHGHPTGALVRSPGLVNRRESEVRQYNQAVEQGPGGHR